MKKILTLAAAMLLAAIGASAQTYVNAGAGMSNEKITLEGSYPADFKYTAVYAGVSHNFKLSGNFGIEPGINYFDSFKTKDVMSVIDSKVKYRYNGLMIPVELTYKYNFASDASLGFYAGPSFNYGFTSTTTTVLEKETISTVDNYELENDGRFTISASVGASFEYESYRLKVNYQYGITNFDLTDTSIKRRNIFTVGLGYAF